MSEQTKVCTGTCGLEKPLSDFHRSKASPDGHKPRCKVCTNEAGRQRKNAWKQPIADERFREGFDAGAVAARKHLACLDDDTLKAAAALTHPDRHPGREVEANRVTALLLAARGGLR
jgi:hypothetical protein